jgi:endoglucanase
MSFARLLAILACVSGVAASSALAETPAPDKVGSSRTAPTQSAPGQAAPGQAAPASPPAAAPPKPAPRLSLDSRPLPLGGALKTPALWQAYKTRFVTDQGRVVDTGNALISHSEGQGYAMLLAIAANDRATFDRVWNWTRANLMVRDDQLIAWRWEPKQRPAVSDMNNASDGDILVAWALAEAGEFWGDPAYRAAGRRIAVEFARKLVMFKTKLGAVLLPAVSGFHADERPDGPVVNLSYYVFPAFARLDVVAPEVDWSGLIQTGLDLLAATRTAPEALPADWLSLKDWKARPADGFPAQFGYDAVRVPLYLAFAGLGERAHYEPFMALVKRTRGALAIVDVTTGKDGELRRRRHRRDRRADGLRVRRRKDAAAILGKQRQRQLLPRDHALARSGRRADEAFLMSAAMKPLVAMALLGAVAAIGSGWRVANASDGAAPAQNTAVATEKLGPDDHALRYYASFNQTVRVDIEISRLRRLYPGYEPPSDLYSAPATGGVDEEPFWALFAADRIDDLRAAIAAKQHEIPGWKPSADLSEKLRRKEVRKKIGALQNDGRWRELVDFIEGEDLSGFTAEVDVLWTVAEAYARAKQTSDALDLFKQILSSAKDPQIRIATIQKALGCLRMADAETLIASVPPAADGTSAFASIMTDITRARIAAFLHGERAEEIPAADMAKFEAYAKNSREANQLGLVAWYDYKRRDDRAALEWFKSAIANDGDATIAHGLAHTLRARGMLRETEEVAYAWRHLVSRHSRRRSEAGNTPVSGARTSRPLRQGDDGSRFGRGRASARMVRLQQLPDRRGLDLVRTGRGLASQRGGGPWLRADVAPAEERQALLRNRQPLRRIVSQARRTRVSGRTPCSDAQALRSAERRQTARPGDQNGRLCRARSRDHSRRARQLPTDRRVPSEPDERFASDPFANPAERSAQAHAEKHQGQVPGRRDRGESAALQINSNGRIGSEAAGDGRPGRARRRLARGSGEGRHAARRAPRARRRADALRALRLQPAAGMERR